MISTARFDLAACSLATFADAVHAAVARVGTSERERFGVRKVYLSAVWAEFAHYTGELDSGGELARGLITLEQFRSRLVEALAAGLLLLNRIDLEDHAPADVLVESTFWDRGAKFNVVIDPVAREPWEADPVETREPVVGADGTVGYRKTPLDFVV